MTNEAMRAWCQHYAPAAILQRPPLVMGILNVTPDSFSDGGRFDTLDAALARACTLIEEGADVIDIGGESTRPFATPVSCEAELARVIPVIEHIRKRTDICISIDTQKPEVMAAAVAAGAGFINDVSGFRHPTSLTMAAKLDVPVCIMHMHGEPLSMQHHPMEKADPLADIQDFFARQLQRLEASGLSRDRIVLDPGFGFGKTVSQNLHLIKQGDAFHALGRPLLLGVSRKSTLGQVLNVPAEERLVGSIALTVMAALQGIAMFRTHDVKETKQALQMVHAVHKSNGRESVNGDT